MFRNLLKLYSGFFVIFIVFNSCSGERSKNLNEIIYWSSSNTEEIEFAKYITDKWNQLHNGSKVRFQPVPEGRSSEEVILAAVVGRTTPDIYSNMWEGDVEVYARAGVLVALDTLKGFKDYFYNRCDSATIAEVTSVDGHIYQIPWKINPIMMIYNQNVINNLGLSEAPKTYSEFESTAEKFKKDNNGDGYIDQWFGYVEVDVTWWQRFFDFYPLYLAASHGMPLVKDNKAAFNNKYAVGVFRFLQQLYRKNYFSREKLSARQDVFLASVIATRFTGSWEIPHADKFKPKGFEYNFQPMPVPDDHQGPVYTYCDPKNIVIFNTCPNPQLAWEFIKFATNEENDLKFLEITGQLPRRKKLDDHPKFEQYFKENPKMLRFAHQANYIRGTDVSPVLKEVFDLISQQYEACVVFGNKTPEEAIKDAADAVDLLFIK